MIFSLSSEGISSYKGPADRVRAPPQLTCLALYLLVRKTHRLAHFSRPDRGEADQGFHLRVRSSSTTPCLNASSSALSKSLAGFAGEVSLQQVASHFPSLPLVFLTVFTAREAESSFSLSCFPELIPQSRP